VQQSERCYSVEGRGASDLSAYQAAAQFVLSSKRTRSTLVIWGTLLVDVTNIIENLEGNTSCENTKTPKLIEGYNT